MSASEDTRPTPVVAVAGKMLYAIVNATTTTTGYDSHPNFRLYGLPIRLP